MLFIPMLTQSKSIKTVFDITIDFKKSHGSYLFDKKSNAYFLDMEGIQQIAPDYLPGMQLEIDKCEDIIHEEISRFVSDNMRRRELNRSHSCT